MLFYYYDIFIFIFKDVGFNCLSQHQQNAAMCKASTFKVEGITLRRPIYVPNFVDNIVVVSVAKLTYYCFLMSIFLLYMQWSKSTNYSTHHQVRHV
jgi:hypothetical protein